MNTTTQVKPVLLKELKVSKPATTHITKELLTRDREKATDMLLQLRYEMSRKVSSIEIK
jgi:hypothetical protein